MAETNKVVPLKPRAAEPVAKKKPAAKKKTTAKKKAAPKTKTAEKKPAVKKAAAKKAAPKKTVAKKTTAKKAAPKKTAPKKTAAKKTVAAKKVNEAKKTAKKITNKKTAAPKAAKKAAPKKVAAKKPAAKKTKIAAKAKPATQPKPALSAQLFTLPTKPQSQLTETLKMTQPNLQQAQAQFDQFTKEAANINREGIDAFVKSSTIFAKGFETLIRETLSFTQSSAEKQMQLAKTAMTSKSINEFSDAQNKIAQTSFDDFMTGTTKITEMGVKILTEAIEPINEQVQKSVQKATEAVAAE